MTPLVLKPGDAVGSTPDLGVDRCQTKELIVEVCVRQYRDCTPSYHTVRFRSVGPWDLGNLISNPRVGTVRGLQKFVTVQGLRQSQETRRPGL